MTNPYIIERRAASVGELQQTFHHIDASRLEYLAGLLAELGRPSAAEMALRWSEEHRLLADRLREVA